VLPGRLLDMNVEIRGIALPPLESFFKILDLETGLVGDVVESGHYVSDRVVKSLVGGVGDSVKFVQVISVAIAFFVEIFDG